MRFDDRVATVLERPVRDDGSRIAAWCQLVDLIAQSGDGGGSPDAYARLREWRRAVPRGRRRAAAAALAGRSVPSGLMLFFAEDEAAIAAPVIAGGRMADQDWIGIIPALSPVARSLLRHRRDLDAQVARALATYGATDLIIAASVTEAAAAPVTVAPAPAAAVEHDPPNIADLVARIEAFQRDRTRPPVPDMPVERATGFRFESDAAGTIDWCEGVPRAELIGVSIAIAAQRDNGVDGHVAGAFRRRAPFRDARLALAHAGAAGGDWRVSGVPFFDVASGRFIGFRGTGRRPRADERAEAPANGLYGSGLPGESLRQLVHEIRTPLNAIIGFAEMIDQQILGPAAIDYRTRAGAILGDARKLLDTVDDLDTAARLEAGLVPAAMPAGVDAAATLRTLCRDAAELTEARDVALETDIAGIVPFTNVDPVSVERMFARLLIAIIGLAAPGERVSVSLGADADDGHRIALIVARTRAIAGRDERALLDPGYSPEGDWPDAPVLGLGFALRLVRNLAEASGGRLSIEPDRFVLILPGATDSPAGREGQG